MIQPDEGRASDAFSHSRYLSIPQTVSVLNAVILTAGWLYFVSHGFSAGALLDAVYELQAAALTHGRLAVLPGPMQVFYHDVLMYWGTYYFYWGLAPSVLFLTLKIVLGATAAHYLTVGLFLFSLVFFFQALISETLAGARGNPARQDLTTRLGSCALVWLLIFVIPYPLDRAWFFCRFAVYEQQILFGLAVALPGIYYCIRGLKHRSVQSLALGTGLFALAAWTRVTWFPFAVFWVVCTAALIVRWSNTMSRPEVLRRLATLLSPAIIIIGGLLLVNEVRFDSPLSFGVQHQNPGHYLYIRNIKMLFSPATRIWNVGYNLMAYYAPPAMLENMEVVSHSFSHLEDFPPSFFYFNPQFLIFVALAPWAAYRAVRAGSSAIVPLGIFAFTTAYLNGIIGFFGTFVILRYFVELLYPMMLLFLAISVAVAGPRIAMVTMVLVLCLHVPATLERFIDDRPELRTLEASPPPTSIPRGRTPFVHEKPVWPRDAYSAANAKRVSSFAAIGLAPVQDRMIAGMDLCTVYLIPARKAAEDVPARSSQDMSHPISARGHVKAETAASPPHRLLVRNLQAIQEQGTALIFLENEQLARIPLTLGVARNVDITLPFQINPNLPHEVMLVFLPEGRNWLPPRSTGRPAVIFREIKITTESAGVMSPGNGRPALTGAFSWNTSRSGHVRGE